jgi:Zn-dependent M28 family amino/carboxypeptidase
MRPELTRRDAHSTNMWPFLPAPGADDDGSGTVTILESYRALLAANFTRERHDKPCHAPTD